MAVLSLLTIAAVMVPHVSAFAHHGMRRVTCVAKEADRLGVAYVVQSAANVTCRNRRNESVTAFVRVRAESPCARVALEGNVLLAPKERHRFKIGVFVFGLCGGANFDISYRVTHIHNALQRRLATLRRAPDDLLMRTYDGIFALGS
ncbi:MAG TPA: hypothetical protein VEC15_11685 [Actinomycetota bacterium]|nr:hypothetical protein [Actinomycetota bacterium]